MTRRSRSFERMTPAAILQRIAGDHSLRADIGEAGPTLAVAAQLNESDLGFLTRVARAVGLDLWAEGEVLHLAAAQDGEAVALRYSGTLRRFEVTADLAHQRTALVVSGWDVARRQSVSHRADDAAAQRELAGGESGASVLNAAFGARVETLAHRAPAGAEEARAMAEGAFRHMARRFVTGTGTAEATAALRPGGRVDLQGIGPLFSGEYRVSEVTHRFDGSEGLVTDFCCQRAGIGRP